MKNILKMCMNWKVLLGIGAVILLTYLFVPNIASYSWVLLVLACPLLETVEKVPFYRNFRISAARYSALLDVYSSYTPASGFIAFARNSEISLTKRLFQQFLNDADDGWNES